MRTLFERGARRVDCHAERGAALVEATLVTILFLTLIGAFIFFFFRFYIYQTLLDAASFGARKVVVDSGLDYETYGNYEDFGEFASAYMGDYIRQYELDSVLNTEPAAGVCYDATSGRCNVRASVFWEVPCHFCEFLSLPTNGLVTFQVPIEDPCFISGSHGCSEVQSLGINCD